MITKTLSLEGMQWQIQVDKMAKLEKDGVPVWHLKNVTIINECADVTSRSEPGSCGEISYSGNYFVADISGHQYYHTMLERYGQFLWLKKHFNDISFLPIGVSASNHYHLSTNKQTMELLRIGCHLVDINVFKTLFVKKYKTITIENIYLSVSYSFLPFLDLFGISLFDLDPDAGDSYVPIVPLFFKELHKRASEIDFPDIGMPKKIFISRELTNLKMHPYAALLKKIQANVATVDDYLQFYNDAFYYQGTNLHFFWANILLRYYPEKHRRKVERYFARLGYTIVRAEELSSIEQACMFRHATHIVAWRGTSCTNFYASNKDVKAFIINNSPLYRHPYPQIVSAAIDSVWEFPEIDVNNIAKTDEFFPANNIIDYAGRLRNDLEGC